MEQYLTSQHIIVPPTILINSREGLCPGEYIRKFLHPFRSLRLILLPFLPLFVQHFTEHLRQTPTCRPPLVRITLDCMLPISQFISKGNLKDLVNIKKIQKFKKVWIRLTTGYDYERTHPSIPKKNPENLESQGIAEHYVIDVRMLAQQRNKIMYNNVFQFFKIPIGQLTHPPTYKVSLNCFKFICPLSLYQSIFMQISIH